ncbi:MAG: DUF4331 domain-containing protein, partial [Acidimicrobiales bacterium]
RQVYSVRRTDGAGSTMLATDLPTPPANIGPRSTPNYETALAAPAVASLPGGGQVFAGTRDDPFFVDLGSVFDLLGLRPLNAAHFVALAAEAGRDGLAGKSVHTIALRLPLTSVLKAGAPAGCTGGTTLDNKDCVIGVYASASRQRVQVLTPAGGVPRVAGRWVQVSRLGIPLVNEVLIPLGQKDRWNASDPADDVANFGSFILNPEPAALIPVLYPGVSTPSGPRTADVLPVLQGAGAGLTGANLLAPADLLRLNTSTPVTASPDRLAILAGDAQGFPNGRRLGDDVVDILLRLLAGGTPFTPSFNISPNNILTDGVDANDAAFLPAFPYASSPRSGYDQPATG